MRGDRGIFTLSLDCEGLWGMADHRATMTAGVINRAALDHAYRFLGDKLARDGVLATAAFVSGFAAPRTALRECLPEFEALAALCPAWFEHLLPRLRKGDDQALDGLDGHAQWQLLADGGHEMAWHGSSHLPLVDTLSDEAVAAELELGRKLGQALGQSPTSVVFPRNLVGHAEALRRAGFSAYRDGRRASVLGRVLGLAREWHIRDRGDPGKPTLIDGWCVLPPGHFLNWPAGPRRLVPPQVTLQRWRSMLRAAASEGRHVHMWFHPHNFITAPAMRPLFSRIMQEAGELIRRGDLLNLTMAQLEARCRAN